jgi:hypothetical protein
MSIGPLSLDESDAATALPIRQLENLPRKDVDDAFRELDELAEC